MGLPRILDVQTGAVPNYPTIKPKRFYRPELDVVRFIAFTSVFLHHLLPSTVGKVERLGHLGWGAGAKWQVVQVQSALGFGLPLFFMLSAYLIGELLLREKDQYKTVNLRAFYIRRILRIWPLYFFGLFIGVCYAIADRSRIDLKALIAFFFMMSIFAPAGTDGPMTPLWSISVEEQFYMFCPVIIKTLTRGGLWVFSSVLIFISDTVLFIMGQMHVVVETAWYNSFVQFQMFGAGLLLCLSLHGRGLEFPKWARAIYLLAVPCSWYVACRILGTALPGTIASSGVSMVLGYSFVSLGCLLILRAFIGLDAKWCPKWVVWLGKISFGLYVYHKLASRIMMSFLTAQTIPWLVGSFALTVVLATLSYYFLEIPFLKIKKRFELVQSR